MKHCRAMFTSRQNFPPKVLDAGETMILFNLPRPWILVCGKHLQDSEQNRALRMQFNCRNILLDETWVQCTPEIHSQADGVFKMSYAINKIIFDYLQVNNDVMLEGDVLQALSELLLQKPQYDWSSIKWHEGTPLPDNVINKKDQGVIMELAVLMDYIVSDTEKEAFQDENTFQKVQNDFNTFMQYTERWHILEFISAMLGMLAMLILIIICIFWACILESIILSSAVMEEYKFVSPSANSNSEVKAFTLPAPFYNGEFEKQFTFRLLTLPPDWEESFVEQEKHIVFLNTTITGVLIIVGLLAILYTVCKKCRYVSSIPRVCFPIYPVSNFLRGTAQIDIFVEVINISTANSIWAYFATCAVHPSQLRITGYPSARNMSIIKVCVVVSILRDPQVLVRLTLEMLKTKHKGTTLIPHVLCFIIPYKAIACFTFKFRSILILHTIYCMMSYMY